MQRPATQQVKQMSENHLKKWIGAAEVPQRIGTGKAKKLDQNKQTTKQRNLPKTNNMYRSS
jgi:hypothetical protein